MAKASLAKLPQSTVDAGAALFGEHPEDVIATIECGASRLSQMAELFKAIEQKAAEGENAVVTLLQIKTLAALGGYVAADTANFIDCQCEQYANTLRGAK